MRCWPDWRPLGICGRRPRSGSRSGDVLADPKSQRFIEISSPNGSSWSPSAPTIPTTKKLYPEFSPTSKTSMVAETRAYFRDLIDRNLDAATW